MRSHDAVTVIAVGGVSLDKEDPDSTFRHVAPVIKAADIALCQLTGFSAERDVSAYNIHQVQPDLQRNVSTIANAGFSIATLTVKKPMEHPVPEAFLEAIDRTKMAGITLVGVGKNIWEARKPCIIDCKNVRIAFLGYSSMLPKEYWADVGKPGCVPVRVLTMYEEMEGGHEIETPDRIVHTLVNPNDKTAMIEDIGSARARVNVVIVSIDWGIHSRETEITEYQREIGHAALDAGADVILGCHAHTLKPIEIYKGKPIFYGLPNFGFSPNPSKTFAVKITVSDNRLINRVSLLPAIVNDNYEPRFVKKKDEEFDEIFALVKNIGKAQNIKADFYLVDHEVAVGVM